MIQTGIIKIQLIRKPITQTYLAQILNELNQLNLKLNIIQFDNNNTHNINYMGFSI